MDHRDAVIMRELWRAGFSLFGFYDPRLSKERLARATGLERTTVRDRLKHWEDTGFLGGFEVMPNPSLFGCATFSGSVCVDDARLKPAAIEALGRVDRVWGWLEHVGPWTGFGCTAPDAEGAQRCLDLIKAVPGVTAVEGPEPFTDPVATVTLTKLDWRLLLAMRDRPGAPFSELADGLPASGSTLARRYERMVDGRALVVMPVFDYARYTGAALGRLSVPLRAGADGRKMAAEFAKRETTVLSRFWMGGTPTPLVDLFLHLDAPAEIADVVAECWTYPDVLDVEVLWPRRFTVDATWFHEQIKQTLVALA